MIVRGEKMEREKALKEFWKESTKLVSIMSEFDGEQHLYGDNLMYQIEGSVIDLIAENPGINITEISAEIRRTISACSKFIKKFVDNGWVEQTRNPYNKRVFNLSLTPEGMEVYNARRVFNEKCQQIIYNNLSEFSVEDIEKYTQINRALNNACMEITKKFRIEK